MPRRILKSKISFLSNLFSRPARKSHKGGYESTVLSPVRNMNLKTQFVAGLATSSLALLLFLASGQSPFGIGEACFTAIQKTIEAAAFHPGTVMP